MKKIGLDIDDVIADFGQYFLQYLKLDLTPAVKWKDPRYGRENFDLIINDEKFWSQVPPLCKSYQLDFEPAAFITARPQSLHQITRKWLTEVCYFPDNIPLFTVGFGGSKASICEKLGLHLFVDDSEHHFEQINENTDTNCLLLDCSHNRAVKTNKRIYSINDCLKWIK